MPSGTFPKSLIRCLVSSTHLVKKKSIRKIQKTIKFTLTIQICYCCFSQELPIGAKAARHRPVA